jgi:hypothetical protein
MCVLACLEGRVLSLSTTDPLWMSLNLKAHPQRKLRQMYHLLPSLILNLIGRSFLMDEQEDGQKFRGRIVGLIEDHESRVEDNPTRIKFRVSVNSDKAEEIITYNNMLEYIPKDDESDIRWKFKRTISHEYKGSQFYVQIEWENG